MSSKPYRKIISLVPSQTELLFDLGLENEVVGLTKFCVHPFYAKQTKTVVGGTKNIKMDKIRSLDPDIILCNKEENTKEIVELCSEICTVHVSDIYTLTDAEDLILAYGKMFQRNVEATRIVDKLRFRSQEFQNFIKNKPILRVAYFIWRNPWMAVGKNTFIDHMLSINKFENIYRSKDRYPEVELKKIRLEGDPEVVFLSSEPYPFKDEHAFEVGRFAHHAKTVFVDGEMFSWYGSRLLRSFDYFKKLRNRLE